MSRDLALAQSELCAELDGLSLVSSLLHGTLPTILSPVFSELTLKLEGHPAGLISFALSPARWCGEMAGGWLTETWSISFMRSPTLSRLIWRYLLPSSCRSSAPGRFQFDLCSATCFLSSWHGLLPVPGIHPFRRMFVGIRASAYTQGGVLVPLTNSVRVISYSVMWRGIAF